MGRCTRQNRIDSGACVRQPQSQVAAVLAGGGRFRARLALVYPAASVTEWINGAPGCCRPRTQVRLRRFLSALVRARRADSAALWRVGDGASTGSRSTAPRARWIGCPAPCVNAVGLYLSLRLRHDHRSRSADDLVPARLTGSVRYGVRELSEPGGLAAARRQRAGAATGGVTTRRSRASSPCRRPRCVRGYAAAYTQSTDHRRDAVRQRYEWIPQFNIDVPRHRRYRATAYPAHEFHDGDRRDLGLAEIQERVAHMAAFLIMEGLMISVFAALDAALFTCSGAMLIRCS